MRNNAPQCYGQRRYGKRPSPQDVKQEAHDHEVIGRERVGENQKMFNPLRPTSLDPTK